MDVRLLTRRRARRPRRRPEPLPAVVPKRLPCVCVPSPRLQDRCEVCKAWDRGTVLLEGGTTISVTQWLILHRVEHTSV